MKNLRPLTRAFVAVAALAMLIAYFVPLWEILLWAPQYPEGLQMYIWLDHLSGDVEIINGLNHYIGMAEIHQEMFPEFGYMGYFLAGIVVFGLLPAITGRFKWLIAYMSFLALCGLLGLWDFASWSYDYGHNLDPTAAIQVPGMTYSPPLLGYKALLNFVAYSGPAIGGWILIGSGVITGGFLAWEILLRYRKSSAPVSAGMVVTALFALSAGSVFSSCSAKPSPIDYGRDECMNCKMLISDARFSAEWITNKGKIHKFDDLVCLLDFVIDESLQGTGYASDFDHKDVFLPLDSAVILHHPELRSPMRGSMAAFPNRQASESVAGKLGGDGGKLLTWNEARELHETESGAN